MAYRLDAREDFYQLDLTVQAQQDLLGTTSFLPFPLSSSFEFIGFSCFFL